jgi:hypothetical protein
VNTSGRSPAIGPSRYEIRLAGILDPLWATWLDDMDVTPAADGSTLVHGVVADQAALHGLLARLRDIGLPLTSLTRIPPDTPPRRPDRRLT